MDSQADLFGMVETARLRLRCVRLEDAVPVSAMMTAAVSQWVASWPVPFTPEMAVERITNARRAAADARALPYAIERRSDAALIGWIGVTREASHDRRAMLGYWLGERHHGHGYMREAAPAAVQMAFQQLDLDVIEAAAQPENAASFAVLRRCGMVPIGETMIFASSRSRDELCLLYEVARPKTLPEGCARMSASDPAQKFDPARAGEYQAQSRIALAGYDACHELAACMLAAAVGPGTAAHILVVGAGGGAQEIVTAGKLEPAWRFTAVDPSRPMMDIAAARLEEHGLTGRTEIRLGYVDGLPDVRRFDAATLIGVLHHLPGDVAKRHILHAIAARLLPGAYLILAGNRYAYADHPTFLAAWGERWRMQGSTPEEVQTKLGKILQGADLPASEEAVAALLADAGFGQPTWFFSSLFWGACIARLAV